MPESDADIATPIRHNDSSRAPSVRPLGKLLAAAGPLWVFDREGRIVYASAECGRWLGIAPEHLLGRSGRSTVVPQAAVSDIAASPDILEAIAAAMAIPAGVERGEIVVRTVRPPAASATLSPPTPRQVLYVPLPAAKEPEISAEQEGSAGESGPGAIFAFADLPLPPPADAERLESRQLVDEVHRQLSASGHRGSSLITLGSTVAAERLNRQIELASRFFTHVTLVGPAGNPVEEIVRRIHAATPHAVASSEQGHAAASSEQGTSGRPETGGALGSPGALVPVAGPLMDAELFDATTGGLADRLLEEETATAALLIHEIDQMPRDAQARLELLIHNHPHRLRIFATSTQSGAALANSLPHSLAALVGTFELAVPALAERIEDIPLLAAALLERRRGAGETRAAQIGRDALDRLVLYPWPGNFAELDGAIRSAARQCRGETIRVEHLPLAIRSFGAPATAGAAGSRAKMVPLDQALERLERELISRALEQSAGNRAAAARMLQISRPRLLRRIEQLGVDRPEQNPPAEPDRWAGERAEN